MNDIQLYGYNGANHLLANNHEINENTAQTSCELAEQAKGRCIYYNASEEGLMYMAKQIKRFSDYEVSGNIESIY